MTAIEKLLTTLDVQVEPFAICDVRGGWNLLARTLRLACGAFLLCRHDAFRDLGGFDEALYAGEELDLSWRLRRWGDARGLRFAIIADPALHTSLRKMELYSARELACTALRVCRNVARRTARLACARNTALSSAARLSRKASGAPRSTRSPTATRTSATRASLAP